MEVNDVEYAYNLHEYIKIEDKVLELDFERVQRTEESI